MDYVTHYKKCHVFVYTTCFHSTVSHTDVPTALHAYILSPFSVCITGTWQQPSASVCNVMGFHVMIDAKRASIIKQ